MKILWGKKRETWRELLIDISRCYTLLINTPHIEVLLLLFATEKCFREAYEATLKKYHAWPIQKAAKLAMGLLPTKGGLVQKGNYNSIWIRIRIPGQN